MEIRKIENGSQLTLALEGRLDTVTAPQLENSVSALDGVDTLTLDFDKLTYISSAGLRVLLMLHKKFSGKGGFTVTNVCPAVKEVFELTGFSDVLNIQ